MIPSQNLIRWQHIDWPVALFLTFTHCMGFAGLMYLIFYFSWPTLSLAVACYLFNCFAVTMGYHRYFTHRSFECAWPLRLFFILFGAASFQKSAFAWAAEHEQHHRYTDTEKDPYNARRGFWWSHIGWLIFNDPRSTPPEPRTDLLQDPLVRFEHRWYYPLAILLCFALPTTLALSWNDPLGGFLVAGWLKLLLEYHVTFSVNSVAHTFGEQPFSPVSARDGRLLAFATFGEGGKHNFHHRFPWDYRNSYTWYQYDPTKWAIKLLSWMGMARNLKNVSPRIIASARITAPRAISQ